jgi:hypothetical protein
MKAPPHHKFGPISIRVSVFLLERRKAGEHVVDAFEAINTAFPGLSFRDFWGGCVLADAIVGRPDLKLVYAGQGGRA